MPLKNSDAVRDYGAGTGLVSLALRQRVSRVLAADSSHGMLDVLGGKIRAAGIANIQPVFLDLEDPARTPPTVDAIVSSMTLHHVRDPLIPRQGAGSGRNQPWRLAFGATKPSPAG